MTLLRDDDRQAAATPDLRRWPAMRAPRSAPTRATVARALMRRVAGRTGVRMDFPDGSSFGPGDGPVLRVVRPDHFLTRLGRDGKIGFGEAFMAGDWDAPDLVAVLERLARHVADIVPRPLQWLRGVYDPRHPRTDHNDHNGARRNIARHYDLSNDLFATFLDDTMTYSSALFAAPEGPESLTAAQMRKVERLLDVAGVSRGSRVLEIGTGWGELAIRAARRGATVTTLTLSTEQAEFARDRVTRAGLDDAVDVRIQDYRDTTGTYDAIVSVEMIEAVGTEWWPTYFRTLDERLAPGGRVGLQAILMPHDRMVASRSSWTWIHKYIFPGGQIPSMRAIEDTLVSHTSLRIGDRLHFGQSYARTLRAWRQQFLDNGSRIASLGFDATFRRMWEFYLAYCEAGFRAGYLDVAQLRLDRGAPG